LYDSVQAIRETKISSDIDVWAENYPAQEIEKYWIFGEMVTATFRPTCAGQEKYHPTAKSCFQKLKNALAKKWQKCNGR